MHDKRSSAIMFLAAITTAAGLGMLLPACGSDSMSSGPSTLSGSANGNPSNAVLGTGGGTQTTSAGGLGGSTSTGSSTGGAASQAGASSVAGSSSVCTSKITWTGGENANMRPGEACNACHASNSEAPLFIIAGTVYPTAHEPADCNGSNSNNTATVVVTDAQGADHTIAVNTAGNFMLQGAAIPLPYKARVEVGGATRSMSTPQSDGDCNNCHTQTGVNGAPGRIMLP